MPGPLGRALTLAVGVAIVCLFGFAASARAATDTVTNTNDSGSGSLREVIADAGSGDTIAFAAGLDGQTIHLTSGAIGIDESLTITGPGASLLRIDADHSSQIFTVSSGNLSISGLTLADGAAPGGGEGEEGKGGAIDDVSSGSLRVSASTFTGNTAGGAGGSADFSDQGRGGAIYEGGGQLTVSDSTFAGNAAGGAGGGGEASGAGDGGAIGYRGTGTLTVSASTFVANTAGGPGAGGPDSGLGAGGAIEDFGGVSLSVSESTFAANAAGGPGGEGFNSAVGFGGAIKSRPPLTVSDSTFAGNSSGGPGGEGGESGSAWAGAIEAPALTVSGSTFTANTAGGPGGVGPGSGTGFGGAIRAEDLPVSIADSTLVGNAAGGSGAEGYGGAIFLSGHPSMTLASVTIDANAVGEDGEGAAISAFPTTAVTAKATIISGNTGATNCDAPVTSSSYSLEGPSPSETSCGFDLPSADPELAPLANNGGPTETQALAESSPAVDAVPAAACPTSADQRGEPRPGPGDSFCDVGAFELQHPGAGASSGYYETHTQTIDAGNSLNAVSCVPGTITCVVADSNGSALYTPDASATSAATWTSWSGLDARPGEAVSCPSSSFCAIAAGEVEEGGGNLYYATSLGGSFGVGLLLHSQGVDAVSCPSASFCVAAQEGGGHVSYSTEPASSRWRSESIGSGAMKGVSCFSASFCAVVDDSGHVHVATTEEHVKEATGWTSTDIDGSTALRGIACTSTTSCVAVDGSGEVLNLAIGPDGEATVSKHGVGGADALIAVTCTGSTCAAADRNGGIFASTDAGADWTMRYREDAAPTSVSCASAQLCAAVTTSGEITTFNPATSVPPLTITTGSLPAGVAGETYAAEPQAGGGEPPYQWSATGLPPGLSIDPASGEISGTPMTAVCVHSPCPQPPATYAATVTATDSNGTQASAPLTIALKGTAQALKVGIAGTGSGEVSSSPAGISACGTPSDSCEASYEDGTVVTLTAKPAAGSTFAGWSGGGCAGTGACQLTVNADTEVSATFSKVSPPPPDHTLTIKLAGAGSGSVHDGTGAISCLSACSHAYADGTQVTLTATPAQGSTFAGWSGGGCAGTGACQLTIGADETLSADFKKALAAPARLRIRSVRSTPQPPGPRITVAGTIAAAARGTVNVTVNARLRGRQVTASARARIANGRWVAQLAAAWVRRHPRAPIYVTAHFAGSPSVQGGHAWRRVRLG